MNHNNASASSERSLELMRLKKEYNQMVKKEISKVKKDNEFYKEASKSPDRSGANSVAGYYVHSHNTSITQKSPYIHGANIAASQGQTT